jgi:hypothetical protein
LKNIDIQNLALIKKENGVISRLEFRDKKDWMNSPTVFPELIEENTSIPESSQNNLESSQTPSDGFPFDPPTEIITVDFTEKNTFFHDPEIPINDESSNINYENLSQEIVQFAPTEEEIEGETQHVDLDIYNYDFSLLQEESKSIMPPKIFSVKSLTLGSSNTKITNPDIKRNWDKDSARLAVKYSSKSIEVLIYYKDKPSEMYIFYFRSMKSIKIETNKITLYTLHKPRYRIGEKTTNKKRRSYLKWKDATINEEINKPEFIITLADLTDPVSLKKDLLEFDSGFNLLFDAQVDPNNLVFSNNPEETQTPLKTCLTIPEKIPIISDPYGTLRKVVRFRRALQRGEYPKKIMLWM